MHEPPRGESQITDWQTTAGDRPDPVARTTAGDVRGVWREGSAPFLGVPFAAPPVGELRFRPPGPHAPWDGVRPATRYGATPQRRPFGELVTIPEPSIPGDSTLNVNVFTPVPGDRDALLPVLVWIHGGGFFAGSPASPWYDGRSFNRDGIVTVTISYRLGFDGFGWTGEGFNRGLQDQIAALHWVQENIRAFGGDPAKVTIGGQSAGAASVLALMASPRTAGLFRAGIAQSGVDVGLPADDVEIASSRLAERLGIPHTRAGWTSLSEDRILDVERRVGELSDAPPGLLVLALTDPEAALAAARTSGNGSGLGWAPAIDGELLTASPAEAFSAGTARDVPLLIGATRNEMPAPAPVPVETVEAALAAAGLSGRAVGRWRTEVELIGPQFAAAQLGSALMMGVPLARLVSARVAGPGSAPTWVYDFAGRFGPGNLAAHCSDLPFTFDLLDAEGVAPVLGESPSQALATAMHADWVDFITTGTAPWPDAAADPLPAARVYEGDGHSRDPEAELLPWEIAGCSGRTPSHERTQP